MGKRYPINIVREEKDGEGNREITFAVTIPGGEIEITGTAKFSKEQQKYIKENYSNIKGYLLDEIRSALI